MDADRNAKRREIRINQKLVAKVICRCDIIIKCMGCVYIIRIIFHITRTQRQTHRAGDAKEI